ncbi:PREDICTED: serine/threonine-protein kinase STY8-like isoform X2 [Camelina sativa]|uniref:Serine/threonine-protein kinase STY8-like isoform X2 n=1 Tax=Camelina sativa TaxID=90675 RepID=A0ABM0X8V3_CAMSA|nr:PREDICTED: serine/threonine-protein kinase STY8-like isoform X2 [Camelina sativa]XP_010482420.1 PREDICTED: serine/threonine-protein kinase STY8-like isoform X2 [Camelina sativa]
MNAICESQLSVVIDVRGEETYYLQPRLLERSSFSSQSSEILDKDLYKDHETINAFKHKLTLSEKVRHPNVVQFVGAVTQNVPMMIVSEYHPKGDLGSYLQNKGCLSPAKILRFALDMARHVPFLFCKIVFTL